MLPRKTGAWLLCASLFLATLSATHRAWATLSQRDSTTSTATPEDYMEVDGEPTALPIRCSTCALVGTSGHLLSQEYGSEIDDQHSCVFRLGFSPNRGAECFVGSRTTARIVDSFSFFPFLKRPWKLVSGPFASEAWILFHRRPGDISRYHGPLLTGVRRKSGVRFLWMTKAAEGRVRAALEGRVYNARIERTSALWFGLKIVEDAGCRSLDVYGVPDHRICKRHPDVATPSLYWEGRSAPVCAGGVDAGSAPRGRGGAFSAARFPTVPERRALCSWRERLGGRVRFRAPDWTS